MLLVLLVVLLIAILLDLSCFLLLLAILSVERWRCVHAWLAARDGGRIPSRPMDFWLRSLYQSYPDATYTDCTIFPQKPIQVPHPLTHQPKTRTYARARAHTHTTLARWLPPPPLLSERAHYAPSHECSAWLAFLPLPCCAALADSREQIARPRPSPQLQ